MEGKRITVAEAKKILGKDFIGVHELSLIHEKIGIEDPSSMHLEIPEIPYSKEYIEQKKDDFILVLGFPFNQRKEPLTLNYLRAHFGWNSELTEPAFYNQDWYLKENFANRCTLELKWYLLQKNVKEITRAKSAIETVEKLNYKLPTALLCSYFFFAFFLVNDGEILWKNDFIWCDDKDHNGDQIYVGKYIDDKGINKNGFSIHRHLAIRKWYGAVQLC